MVLRVIAEAARSWIRFFAGTNGERIGHGAEILLVRWGEADGWLLLTGEGPLRGGFG